MSEFDHAIKLSVELDAEDVVGTSQELERQIQDVFAQSGDKASVPFIKLQASMSRAVSSAQRLQKSMDALRTQPTDSYQDLQNKLEALQNTYNALSEQLKSFQEEEARGESVDIIDYNNTVTKLEDVKNRIATVRGYIQELAATGKDFQVPEENVRAYENMASRLGDVNNKMRVLLETQNAMTTKERESAQASREAAEAKEKEAAAKEQSARAQRVYNSAVNLGSQIVNKFVSTIRGMIGIMKKATVFVGQLAKKLLSMVSGAIQRGIKKLASSMRELSNSAGASEFNFKKALRVVIQYGIGVRSLYFLFRKLRQAVGEGFENLIKFRDGETTVAKAISELKNNLIYLKNAWAAAFAPIVEYVIPAVNTAIDHLADFAHMIGGIFAQLTGKTTMIKAVKNMDGYAESTEQAADEQKKLNRELFSWDELNRQQEDTTSKTADAMNEANEANNMFEEVPVENMLPEWLIDWLDKLKKLWDDGKWFEIGQHIADLLNKGLAFLDNWINTVLAPWAKKWTNAIIEILNGIIDRLDWKLLGKTIGDFINVVVDSLYDFFTKINWEKLGRGIGTALVSMFQTVDWEKLGRVFAARWNALIKFIYGLVTTPGIWKEMGIAVAKFINGWFDEIDFSKAALTVATIINGIFSTIQTVLDNTDIPAGFKKAADAVNLFFNSVDWAQNGKTIADAINTIAEALLNFIGTVDWEVVGESLGTFFYNIFSNIDVETIKSLLQSAWDGISAFIQGLFDGLDIDFDVFMEHLPQLARQLGEMVAGAVNALIESDTLHQLIVSLGTFFVTVFSNIEWGEAKKRLFQDLNEIFQNVDKEKLANTLGKVLTMAILIVAGSNVLKGVLFALGQKLVSLISGAFAGGAGVSFVSSFGTWLSTGIAEAMGMAEPAAAAAATSFGTTVIGALSTALGGLLTVIEGFAAGFLLIGPALFGQDAYDAFSFDALKKAIDDFGDETNTSILGFVAFLGEGLDGIYDHMLEAADRTQFIFDAIANAALAPLGPIKDLILGMAGIETPTSKMADSVKGASEKIEGSFEDIKGGADIALTDANNKILEFADAQDYVWDNTKEKISGAMDGAYDSVLEFADAQDYVWDETKTKVSEAVDDSYNSILEFADAQDYVWEEAKTKTLDTWEAIKQGISDTWDNVKTQTVDVLTFIKDGLAQGWEEIKTDADTNWNALKDSVAQTWDSIKSNIDTSSEAIKTALSTTWESISTTFTQAWETMKTTFATTITEISQTVSSKIDEAQQAVSGKFEEIKQGVEDFFNAVKDFINGEAGSWQDLGVNLIEGLRNGIESAYNDVKDSISNMIDDLVGMAEDILGISSPSKVFKQIGVYVDEGFAGGIEDGSDKVTGEMAAITDRLSKTDAKITPDFDISKFGTDAFDRLASKFSSAMAQVGNLSNLKLPAVATGTVVPAMATSYAGGGGGMFADESVLQKFGDIIYDAVSSAFDDKNNEGGSNGSQVIKVEVSGREIFNAVVDENNRAVQRTGVSPIKV